MKKTTDVLKGKIEDFRRVATRTETSMVTFKVGGTPCKAFGKGAEAVSRWIQFDPNISGEFEGYFETHSQRFGKEFVAVRGKCIQLERINNADRPLKGASGAATRSAEPVRSTRGQTPEAQSIPAQPPHESALTGKPTAETIAGSTQQTSDAGSIADVGKAPTAQMATMVQSVEVAPETSLTLPVEAAQQVVPVEKPVAEKVPEVQGAISRIKHLPTRDGRKMIIFKIGPHNCRLFGSAAEFIEKNASEYEGKRVAVYGDWKGDSRGHREFVPAETMPATQPDPAGALTADEVQRALEEALIDGSGLRSTNCTFEEMEAQYKAREERKRCEQQAESFTAAA